MKTDDTSYILVVEDEDSIRLTLRDYLTRLNLPVLVASDGLGAIKQILDYNISLIVSDYRMEVLGGDYWVRFLQKFCPEKKVLITSGFLKPEFPIPFEVIMKPYNFKDLEARIMDLLEKK